MAELLELIKTNLIHVGCATVVFVIAYVANIVYGLWYNIGDNSETFDKERFIKSIIKFGVFVLGSALLTTAITIIPFFAQYVSWNIPEEFTEIFSGLALIATLLLAACMYAKDAYDKFVAILMKNKK